MILIASTIETHQLNKYESSLKNKILSLFQNLDLSKIFKNPIIVLSIQCDL
jgi:hypothetical protein